MLIASVTCLAIATSAIGSAYAACGRVESNLGDGSNCNGSGNGGQPDPWTCTIADVETYFGNNAPKFLKTCNLPVPLTDYLKELCVELGGAVEITNPANGSWKCSKGGGSVDPRYIKEKCFIRWQKDCKQEKRACITKKTVGSNVKNLPSGSLLGSTGADVKYCGLVTDAY
jgi:hypothetical protein